MASQRTKRMLEIAIENKTSDTLDYLNLPRYESTKGTSREDADKAIEWMSSVNNNGEEIRDEEEPFIDSGSEYLPSDETIIDDTTDDEEESDILIPVIKSLSYKATDVSLTSENEVTSSTDTARVCVENKRTQRSSSNRINEVTCSENLEKIIIKHSEKINNKRFRNKHHACYFCHKLIQNMSRHFETKHSKELEIIKISILPKKSLKRRNEYGALIKAGDFYQNCEVLASKSGELILVRRPTESELVGVTYTDYGPCPKCLGFLLKRHLWHHVKYGCVKSKEHHDDEDYKNSKFVVMESTTIVNGILGSEFPAAYLTNIIEKLRGDEIGKQIKEDNLIMRFGAFLYEKYGDTQDELIRQNMRQVSRLLLELKKIDPFIKSISDSLNPEKFDFVIQATKSLCIRSEGEVVNRPKFDIPSLALKIGYALRKCIGIERGQALRSGHIKRDKMLTSFEMLLNLEWNVRISSNALSSLHRRKLNNTELLPITSDLLVLSKFLEQEIKTTKAALKEKCSTTIWSKLASLTLTRIVLFNKRRSGEAARMTVEQYVSRPLWNSTGSEAVREALSPFEQELAKTLVLVNIVGKRGRHVPVILTAEMKESIDLLIKCRSEVDVLSENPFLFALGGGSLRNIRGHDALKKWCSEANLQFPELVTGTKLRKYIATVCQVFNLTENQTDWLARHLGHDIRVHREFYRLQDNAVELAKVSRLLIAVDQGGTQQFAGKSLDEINIKDLPGILEEAELSDEGNELEDELINNGETEYVTDNGGNGEVNQTGVLEIAKKMKKKPLRKMWSTEQSTMVLKTFKLNVKNKQLPGKADCEKLIASQPTLFKDRKWTDIKFYIKNHLTRIDRMKGTNS